MQDIESRFIHIQTKQHVQNPSWFLEQWIHSITCLVVLDYLVYVIVCLLIHSTSLTWIIQTTHLRCGWFIFPFSALLHISTLQCWQPFSFPAGSAFHMAAPHSLRSSLPAMQQRQHDLHCHLELPPPRASQRNSPSEHSHGPIGRVGRIRATVLFPTPQELSPWNPRVNGGSIVMQLKSIPVWKDYLPLLVKRGRDWCIIPTFWEILLVSLPISLLLSYVGTTVLSSCSSFRMAGRACCRAALRSSRQLNEQVCGFFLLRGNSFGC